MRREDLARDQADAIQKKVRSMLGYLNRLNRRMNEVIAHEDPLFDEVIDAVRELVIS